MLYVMPPWVAKMREEVKVQQRGDEVSLSGHLFMAIGHRGHFLCTIVKKFLNFSENRYVSWIGYDGINSEREKGSS
jgi:hypothetical protein